MNYSFLFAKNDAISYQILVAFNTRENKMISKREIGQTNHFTNYQLHKYYDLINTDLRAVAGEANPHLEEVEGLSWQAYDLNNYVLQRIAVLYLHRSQLYTALVYRFFYENLYTKREYIDANYMSTSVFYRSLDRLDKALSTNHFILPTSVSDNPEYPVRLTLFQLYYSMYNTGEEPFPELNEMTDQIMTLVQENTPSELKQTELTKLSVFARIWQLRMCNKNLLKSDLFPKIKPNASNQKLFKQLTDLLAPQVKLTQPEFNYFYTFLISQGYYGDTQLAETAGQFPNVIEMSNHFMQIILSQDEVANTKLVNGDLLWRQLLSIHLRLAAFYVEPSTFVDASQINFFAELFPAFNQVVNEMVHSLKQDYKIELTDNLRINLYFGYMFALINSIPPSLKNVPVHVCVDFSQGDLYTDYVIDSLNTFNHAHIIIDKDLSDTTDIYISDLYSTKIKLPQIVWPNPPQAKDWSKMADVILKVQHEKRAHNAASINDESSDDDSK